MSSKNVIEQALKLRHEGYIEDEGVKKNLDESDNSLDAIWACEAEKRLKAYREVNPEGISAEKIFQEE